MRPGRYPRLRNCFSAMRFILPRPTPRPYPSSSVIHLVCNASLQPPTPTSLRSAPARLTLPPVSRLQSDSPLLASSLHSFGIHPGRGGACGQGRPRLELHIHFFPARDPLDGPNDCFAEAFQRMVEGQGLWFGVVDSR